VPEFRDLDFELVKSKMRNPIITDSKNMLDAKEFNDEGFLYINIGKRVQLQGSGPEVADVNLSEKNEELGYSVALVGDKVNFSHIIGIMKFFKIPFEVNPSDLKRRKLIIFYRQYPHVLKKDLNPVLYIPSQTKEFRVFITRFNVRAQYVRQWARLKLGLRNSLPMIFHISSLYRFSGPIEVLAASTSMPLLIRVLRTNVNLLCVDLIEEISKFFNERLNLKPTTFFKFCSHLRLSSIFPRGLGNKILRQVTHASISLDNYISHMNLLDGLRYLFLAAMVISAQVPFRTLGFWKKGSRYAATITHDVDTKYGFNVGIGLLRDIERKYGVRSAWNIPVGHYLLKREVIRTLVSEGCEVGSHGTRHNGQLILLDEDELLKILRNSRLLLGQMGRCKVKGFRSPLLQHSNIILEAVKKAGYLYDSSLPAWEAYCRTSEGSHGIGTVYPLNISEDLVELPATLPQDHQLMYLGGLSPKEIFKLWKILKDHIKSLHGFCNIIIHPDKDLLGHEDVVSYYEEFVEEFAGDPHCWLTTPSEVAEWWALRSEIEVTPKGKCVLSSGEEINNELEEAVDLIEYKPSDFVFK